MRLDPRVRGRAFAVHIACGLLALETGCPGSLDRSAFEGFSGTTAAAPVDAALACPDVPSTLFASTCALAGCHAGIAPQGGLDLASPDLKTRLVGSPASGGGLLVDPADPSSSVLFTKLGANPPFGARMPFGGAPLDSTRTACILDWIEGLSASPDAGVDGLDAAATPVLEAATADDAAATLEAAPADDWTPLSVKGVVLWLDAHEKVTVNGSTISRWGDRSMFHNDAAPVNAATAPTLSPNAVHGSPALQFDETKGQYVSIADSASLQWGTGGFVVAIVANDRKATVGRGHGGGVSTVFAKPHMTGAVEIAVHLNFFTTENADDDSVFHFGIGEGYPGVASTTNGDNDGSPRLYVARLSPSGGGMDMEVRVDGTTVGTTHATSTVDVTLAGSPVRIGSTYGQNVNGDVAEIVAVKGALGDADLGRLEGYLTSKYALKE